MAKDSGAVSKIGKGESGRRQGWASPLAEMERLFDDMFSSRVLGAGRGEWPLMPGDIGREGRVPRVDIIDRDKEFVVRAEMPGVDKKDIDISISENAVTLRAETRREEREEKESFFRSEISAASYSRTIPLPAPVNADGAKANLRDGVLELTLPKTEPAGRRKIAVE
ncbi:MAG TPA: Hsp20/alpha crystallin family protein [Gammaproteobacteria bacterium]|nr:Hsp20/alpha crystallin family protein [Gammaproteobacteria bacterium]